MGGGVNGERELHKMLKFGDEVFGMKANLNRSGPWADRHSNVHKIYTRPGKNFIWFLSNV